MARFVYRLQKVFELRERRVKEQEQRLIKARRIVQEIEDKIEEKKNEIRLLRQNMLTAPHTLMGSHDEYIHKCNHDLDQLDIDLQEAEARRLEEAQRLVQYQAELEALEKHKEKSLEEWKEEQKQTEMKQMNEVAGQRYFRATLEAEEEAREERQSLEEERLDEEKQEKKLRAEKLTEELKKES